MQNGAPIKLSSACRERERFRSDAVTIHSAAVTRMAQLAGWRLAGAFGLAKQQVAETKGHVQSAKQEFEAHVREHGSWHSLRSLENCIIRHSR
jgi:hypothetical protein